MGLFDRFRRNKDNGQEIQVVPDTPARKEEPSKELQVTKPVVTTTASINRFLEVSIINQTNEWADTLVIQYDRPQDLHLIQSTVAKGRRKNATADFDQWRTADVFVDIGNLDPESKGFHDRKWQRIVYECLYGNPNPGKKFQDAMIIRIRIVNHPPLMDLQLLLGGGK